jgi:hypothetical protein
MKKLAAMVAGGLLLCGGVGVATADSRSLNRFKGTLTLAFNPSRLGGLPGRFKAIRRKERIFEDAVFLPTIATRIPCWLRRPICFSGTITDATLGGRAVEASSLSALTVNSFPLAGAKVAALFPARRCFTAATVVTVTATESPEKIRNWARYSCVIPASFPATDQRGPLAIEQLIGVGGTKKFSNASVSMEIVGYEFARCPGQRHHLPLSDGSSEVHSKPLTNCGRRTSPRSYPAGPK